MTKIIIAAVARNGVIGRGNDIPWHFPEDLRIFKRETTGHAIIMGRRTFESVGSKPLHGRLNVVLSRTMAAGEKENFIVAPSLDEAFTLCMGRDKAFVAGGSEVYRLALPMVDEIWLTEIPGEYEGDTFFPVYPISDDWHLYHVEQGESVTFRRYNRVNR